MRRYILFFAILVFLAGMLLVGQKHPIGLGGGTSTAAGVVALFTGCSGTQYLGADGACHNAAGAPAFSSITSATNTTAAMIVGTGASLASTPEFDIGAVGTNGVLGLKGTTSGTATFTAPAVAGTVTNFVTSSNSFSAPVLGASDGTQAAPAFTRSGHPDTGWYFNGSGVVYSAGNTDTLLIGGTPTVRGASNLTYAWTPTNSANSPDTAISRDSAGVVDVGTGAQGAVDGTIKPGKYATGTNCSSSASPAVCASAAAGSVALPTGTNPTLVVNTTDVTANSQIFLNVDEGLGTKLGVTCNTTLSTLVNPVVTARTAATSFTFTIGAIIATNPACVSYFIVN